MTRHLEAGAKLRSSREQDSQRGWKSDVRTLLELWRISVTIIFLFLWPFFVFSESLRGEGPGGFRQAGVAAAGATTTTVDFQKG